MVWMAPFWGCEAILVEGKQWSRQAHLRTFVLPGGDRAARERPSFGLGRIARNATGQIVILWRAAGSKNRN